MKNTGALALLSLTSVAVPVLVACGSRPPAEAPPVTSASASASAEAASTPAAVTASAPAPTASSTTSFGMTAYVGDGGAPPADTIARSFGPGGLVPAGASSSATSSSAKYASGPPSIREGQVTVNGKLPVDVIKRIVRQNFGVFRKCYESGLAKDPTLEGRVAVKFVIDKAGSVSSTADGGSDMKDGAVVSCIVRRFATLSFPQPDGGGIVTVLYPVLFAPPPP